MFCVMLFVFLFACSCVFLAQSHFHANTIISYIMAVTCATPFPVCLAIETITESFVTSD